MITRRINVYHCWYRLEPFVINSWELLVTGNGSSDAAAELLQVEATIHNLQVGEYKLNTEQQLLSSMLLWFIEFLSATLRYWTEHSRLNRVLPTLLGPGEVGVALAFGHSVSGRCLASYSAVWHRQYQWYVLCSSSWCQWPQKKASPGTAMVSGWCASALLFHTIIAQCNSKMSTSTGHVVSMISHIFMICEIFKFIFMEWGFVARNCPFLEMYGSVCWMLRFVSPLSCQVALANKRRHLIRPTCLWYTGASSNGLYKILQVVDGKKNINH